MEVSSPFYPEKYYLAWAFKPLPLWDFQLAIWADSVEFQLH